MCVGFYFIFLGEMCVGFYFSCQERCVLNFSLVARRVFIHNHWLFLSFMLCFCVSDLCMVSEKDGRLQFEIWLNVVRTC